jgi:hypothetical protein
MATGDVQLLREKLVEIVGLYPHDHALRELVAEAISLTRRSRVKRVTAKAKARGEHAMSDSEIKAVIRYSRQHPHLSNREVGALFGCDGGRVSEYCGTKRTARLDRLREEVARGI